jgi:hypothetical protein
VEADELVVLRRFVGLTTGSGAFLAGSVAFLAVLPDGLRTGAFVREGREAVELAEEDWVFLGGMFGWVEKRTHRNSVDSPSF